MLCPASKTQYISKLIVHYSYQLSNMNIMHLWYIFAAAACKACLSPGQSPMWQALWHPCACLAVQSGSLLTSSGFIWESKLMNSCLQLRRRTSNNLLSNKSSVLSCANVWNNRARNILFPICVCFLLNRTNRHQGSALTTTQTIKYPTEHRSSISSAVEIRDVV